MKVASVQEMKAIEKEAIENYGFDEVLIIENVGIRGADFLEKHYFTLDGESSSPSDFGELVFLVGRGNNGADALAIARHLANRHFKCRAFLLFPDENGSDQYHRQLKMAQHYGVKISELRNIESLETYFTQTQSSYFVVDGVLGTGFHLPISNYLFEIFETVNKYSNYTVSIDIPSGITGEKGAISSTALRADLTLGIALAKTGHYISHGAEYTGKLVVLDVGFPSEVLAKASASLLTPDTVAELSLRRNPFAHKNTFGHSLVVGGSQGLTGALLMSSEAALKVGTGLVTAATWHGNYHELASRSLPEIMTGLIPTEKEKVDDMIKELSRYDSIVLGPGLGRNEKAREAILEVLSYYSGPVVIDADAIRCLKFDEDLELFQRRKGPAVFTPHIGEFADMIETPVKDVLEDPLGYLKRFVDETNCCLILKGACSYMGFPNGEVFVSYYPNDGMATGGSGDVLAGILGGMLAQYLPERQASGIFVDKEIMYRALCLGMVTHTLAGKFAARALTPRPMIASSIIEHFPKAFQEMAKLAGFEYAGPEFER